MKICLKKRAGCFFGLKFSTTALFLLTLVLQKFCLTAAELHPRDKNHRGLVQNGEFSYYPENRLGNGLYREGKLLASESGRLIFEALEIRDTNSVVYLYSDPSNELHLGLVNDEGDGNGRLKSVDAEFYEYTNNDIGYQRIFRLLNGAIVPVLEKIRTGTGVTLSDTHAVFYHIIKSGSTKVTTETGEEVETWSFTFRLHLTKRGQKGVVTLFGMDVQDKMASLKLFWKDEHTLVVSKSTGMQMLFDLKNYASKIF